MDDRNGWSNFFEIDLVTNTSTSVTVFCILESELKRGCQSAKSRHHKGKLDWEGMHIRENVYQMGNNVQLVYCFLSWQRFFQSKAYHFPREWVLYRRIHGSSYAHGGEGLRGRHVGLLKDSVDHAIRVQGNAVPMYWRSGEVRIVRPSLSDICRALALEQRALDLLCRHGSQIL